MPPWVAKEKIGTLLLASQMPVPISLKYCSTPKITQRLERQLEFTCGLLCVKEHEERFCTQNPLVNCRSAGLLSYRSSKIDTERLRGHPTDSYHISKNTTSPRRTDKEGRVFPGRVFPDPLRGR